MLRRLAIATAALTLTATLGLAEPLVRADLSLGTPRVVLEGNWAGASYNVFRSDAADAPFVPVLSRFALCTGECFAFDPEADIGASYYYRFDVIPADGPPQSFGPFLVPIGPRIAPGLHASVSPNPVRGTARFRIAAGTYFLRFEAPGYRAATTRVSLVR